MIVGKHILWRRVEIAEYFEKSILPIFHVLDFEINYKFPKCIIHSGIYNRHNLIRKKSHQKFYIFFLNTSQDLTNFLGKKKAFCE